MKKVWLNLKNQVLGEKYDLSFSYAGSDEMRRLNNLYRKKDCSANVLSFPLSSNEGEILINKNHRRSAYADYLFIHSLLHLKGLKHGKKMDEKELEIMKKNYPKNYEKIMSSV
mgnify:CR=1 FL=1